VYFRLSALGWFVWERLDGTRNVRDLALAYLSERGGFAPEGIARLIASLGRSGFLDPATMWIPEESQSQVRSLGALAGRARAILTWHADVRNIDNLLTHLYGTGIRHLYGRAGQVMLGILAVLGVVATIVLAANGLDGSVGAWWWFLIPGLFLSLMIHEAGHAFTAKAFGYEVRRAGVGWFWIGPMAFVDTSDVWLASRKQRLLVALAGPYATILFAGTCAIVGLVWSAAAPACLVLALSSYISVFTNLNPLIELDGYYVLVHLTDRPNLRMKALGWLGTEGPSALRHPSRFHGHGLDAAYALASIGYLIVVGVLIVLVYRAVLEAWVTDITSPTFAAILAWITAGAVCTLLVAGVIGDLIQARERSQPH
jgi:putative peptide zinc metalloprotease protein